MVVSSSFVKPWFDYLHIYSFWCVHKLISNISRVCARWRGLRLTRWPKDWNTPGGLFQHSRPVQQRRSRAAATTLLDLRRHSVRGFRTNGPNTNDARFCGGLRGKWDKNQTRRARDKQHGSRRREGGEGTKKTKNKNKKLASTLYGKLNSTSKIKSTSKINSFKNKANQLKRFSSDRRKKKKNNTHNQKKQRTLKFYKLKQNKKSQQTENQTQVTTAALKTNDRHTALFPVNKVFSVIVVVFSSIPLIAFC